MKGVTVPLLLAVDQEFRGGVQNIRESVVDLLPQVGVITYIDVLRSNPNPSSGNFLVLMVLPCTRRFRT